jgi:alpha-beta hydrolase superfamily lysophospholipase
VIKEINLTPTSTSFEIPRKDGSQIPARSWGNSADCKAVALLVHGLGAHSGWFEAFGRQLKVRRVYAVSFDHIGFGKQKEHGFSGYTDWLDDLVAVYDYLRETNPNKPIYLCGNSMGALLSLVATEHIEPDGLVLLSPGFDGAPQTFTMAYRVLTVVKALLRPDMEVTLPYNAELVSRDLPTRVWITNDPEGRFSVPGKMLLALLKLSNAVKHKARTVKMPVLMLTAGMDQIINTAVNVAFFEKLTAPAKRAKVYDEAFHDLMFDPVIDEVADEVVHWMSEHTLEKLISG